MPARLLFDASFPASVEQFRSLDMEIWRWGAERVHDKQLLETAHREGFVGVVFLGLQPLSDPDVTRTASRLGLYLAVTVEEDPIEAVRAVTNMWAQIVREAGPGKVHQILARELRPVQTDTSF
jgi:hypothetical protein